jgi:1-acyl-sn-glycerol-3-phosphate acyltransferase
LRLLQYLYCLYALLLFVAIMLLILPLVAVFSLWGAIRGGNLIYKVLYYWARIWYPLVGIRHKAVYAVPHDRRRQYIFVANHNSYMDIPPIVRGIHQPVRVLGKYEMAKIPLFGFIYRKAVVLVDRSSALQRAKSVERMKAFIKKGISVFIFPEGTFNETGRPLKNFHDGAFRIAIETGTPIKPVLFPDNLHRMHYKGFFTLTPGRCRMIFLEEITVTNHTTVSLKQEVFSVMQEALLRYGFGALPNEEQKI